MKTNKLILFLTIFCLSLYGVAENDAPHSWLEEAFWKAFREESALQISKIDQINRLNEIQGKSSENKYIVYLDCRKIVSRVIKELNEKKINETLPEDIPWIEDASNRLEKSKLNQISSKYIVPFDNTYNAKSINGKKAIRFYLLYIDHFPVQLKSNVKVNSIEDFFSLREKVSDPKSIDRMASRLASELATIPSRVNLEGYQDWVIFSTGNVVIPTDKSDAKGKRLYRQKYFYYSGYNPRGIKIAKSSKGSCFIKNVMRGSAPVTNDESFEVYQYLEGQVKDITSALSKVLTNDASFVSFQCGQQGPSQLASGAGVVNYASSVNQQAIQSLLSKVSTSNQSAQSNIGVYITDQGTSSVDRGKVNTATTSLKANEMMVWIDFDEKGKSKPLQFFYGSDYKQLTEFQKVMSGVFSNLALTPTNFNPFTAILDGLAHLIGKAAVPEKFYNPDLQGYDPTLSNLYYNVSQANPGSIGIQSLLKEISIANYNPTQYQPHVIELAFYCGLWNGLVGTLESAPELASFLIKISTEQKTREEFVSGWRRMKEKAASQGGYMNLFWSGIVESHTRGGNACLISHQIGEDVFNVATFFLAFAKTGALARAAQLLDAIDPMSYLFRGATGLFKFAVKGVVLTYRVGIAGSKLLLKVTEQGTKVVFELLDEAGNRVISRVSSSLDELLEGGGLAPGLVLADGGSFRALGVGDAKSYKSIVDNAGKEIKDEYGNFLAEVKTSSGDFVLAIVGEKVGKGVANVLESLKKRLKQELKWSDELIESFEKDFKKKPDLLDKFVSNELDARSWEILYSQTSNRTKESALASISKVLKKDNPPISLSKLKEIESARVALAGKVKQAVKSQMPSVEDLYKEIDKFLDKYPDATGTQVLESLSDNTDINAYLIYRLIKEVNTFASKPSFAANLLDKSKALQKEPPSLKSITDYSKEKSSWYIEVENGQVKLSLRDALKILESKCAKCYQLYNGRDKLRDAMWEDWKNSGKNRTDFNELYKGWEAHHLIPIEVLEESEILQFYFNKCSTQCLEFNTSENGMMLTTLRVGGQHGNHPEYTKQILDYLKAKEYSNSNSDRKIAEIQQDIDFIIYQTQKRINAEPKIKLNELDLQLSETNFDEWLKAGKPKK
jgi:hypothetical protein